MEQDQRTQQLESLGLGMEALAPARSAPSLRVLQVCSARVATYGAVSSMMSLSLALREAGHSVEFATFRGKALGTYVGEQGYRYHEFAVRTKIDPIAITRLARTMRRNRYEIVHTHLSTSSVNGCLAARLARIPCVATVHGLSGKLSFVAADHLIAVSADVRRHLTAQGLHESKISIVHNGVTAIPPAPGSRERARAELGLDPDARVVGSTARLTPLKGVDTAIQAISRLAQDWPDIRYVVFGDGEQEQELRSLAASLQIARSVVFAGYRNDLTELLPALDVFLFPTLREAMGIAVIEAMVARVPVVATRVGGIPEVVKPGTGILVEPSDPVALSEAAARILRDPEVKESLVASASSHVREHYSSHRMAQRTLAVYEAILARATG